ncbi:MAG TPA: RagB/SusD family nutrient uptake outer membrane protein, partial [Longimicrobiaceae bacterium]|nr:RagB/SusD family nutrient uptake outer membrane protein [Longimicrobiaceae bacterium]
LIIPGTSIPVVSQAKYMAIDASIPMARWAEAQLIRADIAHASNDLPTAIGHVNALRDVHSLPNYTVAAPTAQEVKDLILEERRREFFLEGRWAGTKILENLWFPLGEGAVPTGYQYLEGTCMLMPEVEYELNPNLSG